MSFFNETKYDPQQHKPFKPFYSIKEGVDNIYRLAPSCRNLPPGEYAVYKKVHFGYGVPDNNNPDKIRARPFECIQKINFKTKMVEVVCPECQKIAEVLAEKEKLEESLKEAGHPPEYIKQATSPQMQWLKEHNLDNKWYSYAKNRNHEWNVFKFGHKVKLAIDEVMKRLYKDDGIKALDPSSGVWLKFTKNGLTGSKALTTVEVLREKTVLNGQKVEITADAPLTEVDINGIGSLLDVTTCVTKLNFEQINALVSSGGDPETAKRIFSLGQKVEQPAPTATSTVVTTVVTQPQPAAVTTATPAVTASKPVTVSQPAKPTMPETTGMTPDEFLRMFANKG
jgi:hypothetical protein